MIGGWIKLWRKIDENPLLRRPAYLAVWIEVLWRATHEETISVMFGGKQVYLKPGQFTTGTYQISVNRGVPRGTVVRILKAFVNEQMIEQRTDRQCTLITVKNWHKYQDREQRSEQRVIKGSRHFVVEDASKSEESEQRNKADFTKSEQRVVNEWSTSGQRVITNQEGKNGRINNTIAAPSAPLDDSRIKTKAGPGEEGVATSPSKETEPPPPVARPPSPIQEVVNHFMDEAGFLPSQRNPAFSRHTPAAKNLLKVTEGDVETAKTAITACKRWAASKRLDWTLETVINNLHKFMEI